jgi:hypothetical protein
MEKVGIWFSSFQGFGDNKRFWRIARKDKWRYDEIIEIKFLGLKSIFWKRNRDNVTKFKIG